MGISAKDRHSKALSKIRELFPNYLKVEYDNGVVLTSIPCTIAREKIENTEYNSFVGRNTIIFNILIDDLKKQEAPLKNFSRITHNRVVYVVDKVVTSPMNDTIRIYCEVNKRGNN